MNPTDQARKEARKKELKKNKLQRLKVRQEVIKQKDPKQIFNELEAIDKIEYDINNPPLLNAKVLQEKRRKLKEGWHKMFQFYQKEDPKTASELKAMELDYERRRHQLSTLYESVMQAQKVKLDEIPLPSMTMLPPPPPTAPGAAEPLTTPHKSILKTKSEATLNKQPPGPPSGPPPDLSEFDAEEYDTDLADELTSKQNKKIRFDSEEPVRPARAAIPPPPSLITPSIPTIPLQAALTRPNLIQPPPPPPPPIAQPVASISQAAQYQQISKSIQQQIQANSRLTQQQQQQQQHSYYQQASRTSESSQTAAAAALAAASAQSYQSTIEAKPLLRNKIAEVTRFVPTSLVVKRTESSAKKQPTHMQSTLSTQQMSSMQQQGPYNYMLQHQQQYATLNPLTTYRNSSAMVSSSLSNVHQHPETTAHPQPIINSTTPTAKRIDDAAYASFMKEIGKLL